MESNLFRFSEEQRRALALHVKRRPVDMVQSFLNRCEYAITEWQADWPAERMAGNKGASDNLRALSYALLRARCEIMKLPEGASCALWLRLHEEQTGKNTTKPWTVRSAYLAQLLALEQTAGTLAGEFSDAGGVVKYRERDLVDKLVQAYFDSFNLQPSSSGGPFMLVLGELQEYMRTLLGENNLTMGRDIVRASIKWHKQREAQLAGMYEFPEKQDR